MLFPDDVWSEVMSYFHSPLRKTPHHDSMNALLSDRPAIGWKRVRHLYDSYYLFLVSDVYIYERHPEIVHLKRKAPFYIHRVVHTGRTKRDFIDVWDAYTRLFPCHHLIRFVRE